MISGIETGSEEKHYEKRQRERFPLHICELPFNDRVHIRLPAMPTAGQRTRMWLLLQLEAWRKHPALRLIRSSNFAIEMEQVRQARSKTWWLIHPLSRFWMFWQLIIIVSSMMVIFVFPFYEAFIEVQRFTTKMETKQWYAGIPTTNSFIHQIRTRKIGLLYMLKFCDGIFFIHIFFKFFTGYNDPQFNMVVMNEKEIMKRYLKTWFVPDLLSEVPMLENFANFIFKTFESEVDYTWRNTRFKLYIYTFFYAFRLVRLYDTLKYLRKWLGYYKVNVTLRFYTSLFIGLLVFAQWTVYFMVRVAYLVNATNLTNPKCVSWTREPQYDFLNVNRSLLFFRQYVSAMDRVTRARGSFSLHTILPKMADEDILVILAWMWISSYFMILMLVVSLNGYEMSKCSQVKMKKVCDELVTFRMTRQLNHETYQRLLAYYSKRFECQYYNVYSLLDNLPQNIRDSIQSARCRNVLTASLLFRNMSQTILKELARHLIEDLFLPHDVIYCSGSESTYLYLLSIGTVGVYLSTGEEVGHLADGDFFGEIGDVLQDGRYKRMETVVALEFCQVFKLPQVTLRQLLKSMPKLLARIRTIALDRAQDLASFGYNYVSDIASADKPLREEDDEEYITGTNILSDEETSSSELDEALMKKLTEHPIFNPPRKI